MVMMIIIIFLIMMKMIMSVVININSYDRKKAILGDRAHIDRKCNQIYNPRVILPQVSSLYTFFFYLFQRSSLAAGYPWQSMISLRRVSLDPSAR